MSFFRYPGGKSKLKSQILSVLKNQYNGQQFREPFFGGGSIGLGFINGTNVRSIWINDKDIGLSALWTSVIKYPSLIKKLVKEYSPNKDDFYSFKDELISVKEITKDEDFIVNIGFKKLVIHQISYSGLGTKSGGPLGGKDQKSDYKIDCRWSPSYICDKIDKITSMFNNIDIFGGECTNLDYSDLIKMDGDALIYLDPPYFIKGNELYQHGFSIDDHIKLSNLLKDTKHKWLLSYDDCEQVRQLYRWADITDISVNYSINGNYSKKEILIYKDKNVGDLLESEFVDQFFTIDD